MNPVSSTHQAAPDALLQWFRERGPTGVSGDEMQRLAPYCYFSLLNELKGRGHHIRGPVSSERGGLWVLDDDQQSFGA